MSKDDIQRWFEGHPGRQVLLVLALTLVAITIDTLILVGFDRLSSH